MALLEVRDLCVDVGPTQQRRRILRDVNFTIDDGQFVCITGAARSGKSTLTAAVAGLIRADGGEVRLRGKVVSAPGPDLAAVFHEDSCLPWLTVRRSLDLAVKQVFPRMSRGERRDYLQTYVEMLQLEPFLPRKAARLTLAMQRRLALACMLSLQPRVLILDEPLRDLDADSRDGLRDDIERIWRNTGQSMLMMIDDAVAATSLTARVLPLVGSPGNEAHTLGPEITQHDGA